MKDKLEAISISLNSARKWKEKGDDRWVEMCLSGALPSYLSIAVTEFPDADSGIRWMSTSTFPEAFSEYVVALSKNVQRVDSGTSPSSVIGGNYLHLVLSHLAWLLENFELGEYFVALSNRADVLQHSTLFWREYANAMKCLVTHLKYAPSSIRLRGQEAYWSVYLQLTEAITSGSTLTAVLAKVDSSFEMRQSDKKIKDDNYEIEGSRTNPVRWDFRKAAILAYARKVWNPRT